MRIILLTIVVSSNLFAQSSVGFKIRNAGLNVEGKFVNFEFNIGYQSENLAQSRFEGWVEVASIATGIKLRDRHLLEKDYFHASQFPKISFKSTQIVALTANKIKISGELTIKSTTKNIELEVEIKKWPNSKVSFSTTFTLNRLDFGVGERSWVLSDEVEVYVLYAE